jgi:DNA-binding LytR/AlgR family response regulator
LENPIRVLVVEDDPLLAELLVIDLMALGYVLLGPTASPTEARTIFRTTPPDLLLLDIGLRGETTDGIELAAELVGESATPLIFLTSFTDAETFARARAVGPAAYLTKPADQGTLQRAIKLALDHFAQAGTPADAEPEAVLEWPQNLLMKAGLFVKERGRWVKVSFEEVLFIEADDRHSILVTATRRHALRLSLRELARELPTDRFLQSHRAYLVNAEHLQAIDPGLGVLIVGGQEVPLSRTFKDTLLRHLRTVG